MSSACMHAPSARSLARSQASLPTQGGCTCFGRFVALAAWLRLLRLLCLCHEPNELVLLASLAPLHIYPCSCGMALPASPLIWAGSRSLARSAAHSCSVAPLRLLALRRWSAHIAPCRPRTWHTTDTNGFTSARKLAFSLCACILTSFTSASLTRPCTFTMMPSCACIQRH